MRSCPQTFPLPMTPYELCWLLFYKNVHLAGLWEKSGLGIECIQLGRAGKGRDKEVVAEVDTVSQVQCTLSSCLCSFQRPWFNSCLKAVLQGHADRAWLPSVRFQTQALEAHSELKVALKKYICII